MLLHFLVAVSTALLATAYALAAAYAHLTKEHQDMCPFYMLAAVASMLHAAAAIIQWWTFAPAPTGKRDGEGRAPVGPAQRIIYYDHNGEPIFTEWKELPPNQSDEQHKAA